MAKSQILISVQPNQTRIVHLEENSIISASIYNPDKPSLSGSIYQGRVSKVLSALGACFVDIGLKKDCFLYFKELLPFKSEEGVFQKPSIKNIKAGQNILVQIIKDPLGSKGPRLSMQISLAGPYLVYMPHSQGVGVSKKIESEIERNRIIEEIKTLEINGGVIARTKAQGKKDFKTELLYLQNLWEKIQNKNRKTPGLIYPEISPELQAIRDGLSFNKDQVWIDDSNTHKKALEFVKKVMPDFTKKIFLYEKPDPLFEKFGVETKLNQALNRKVHLKSGGSIVIDENEALVSIDVNTSKFIGKKSQENTILKTNLEAVKEIAQQIRVRNCGGIIVIDLIDMNSQSSKNKVIKELEKELEKDRSYTEVVSVSPLNIIEMTRKRVRPSLRASLCSLCKTCSGSGWVKSPHTIACEIFSSLQAFYRNGSKKSDKKPKKIQITCHPKTLDWIKEHETQNFENLEKNLALDIDFKEDSLSSLDEFEIEREA